MRNGCWLLALLIAGLTLSSLGYSQEVPLAKLKGIDLVFTPARAVNTRPGPRIQLRVSNLPGDEFALRLPFTPNRIEPLVAEGALVKAGDPLVRIFGPELEAWLIEAADTKQRFEEARKRYERNRPLFEQNALSSDTWLAISDRYQSLRLAMHHVEHVTQWLDAGSSQATLRSPSTGLVRLSAKEGESGPETTIATIIAPRALRLVGSLSADTEESAVDFRVANCRVAIDRQERIVSGFRRLLWSEPASTCVPLQPGLRFSGRISFAMEGFAIPKAALLRSAGRTVVALRRRDTLVLTEVQLRGEDTADYYVTGPPELAQQPLLSSSTSALQGLLAGLGAD